MISRVRGLVLSAALAATVGSLPALAETKPAGAAFQFRVAIEEGLLSVRLEKVPLAEVLHEIGKEAGIRVIISGELGAVRPQSFQRLPLEAGIARLVGDNGLVMIRAAPDDATRTARLTQIMVYGG